MEGCCLQTCPSGGSEDGGLGVFGPPVTLPILCAQEACSWRAGLKGISQWGLHRPSPSYPLPSNDTRITVEKALLQPSSKTKSRTIIHLPPACLSPSSVSLQTPPVRAERRGHGSPPRMQVAGQEHRVLGWSFCSGLRDSGTFTLKG